MLIYHHIYVSFIAANVRVYDHLRWQSDYVSRYTKDIQGDTASNPLPSN